MIKVINIKADMPYPDCAVYELEHEIEINKLTNINALIVIHGYGSHGYGGKIKEATIEKLAELKNFGKIKNYIKGEMWGDFNDEVSQIKNAEPELILHPLLKNLNSGVSVVWIKK